MLFLLTHAIVPQNWNIVTVTFLPHKMVPFLKNILRQIYLSLRNRYDRSQIIIGGGGWYRNFTFYVTPFISINGQKGAPNFASLKNKGITYSLSYDISNWQVRLHKTTSISNSGNELTFSLEYLIPLVK